LYWGTSEWPAEAIQEAHRVAQAMHMYAPVVEQPQYNLLHRERVEQEYAPLYESYGMGTTIWSPLASGLLSGKYSQGVPQGSRITQPGYEWLRDMVLGEDGKRVEKVKQLAVIATELGVTSAQLAIAWCLTNPHVSTVLLGASRREQLEQNFGALDLLPRFDAALKERIEGSLG
jgi:aryl-alcohol dehydrogenase-like predicted oxidoreductase